VRIIGPDALGEDIGDSHGFHDGSHRTARYHAGSGCSRLEQNLSRSILARNLVRDGAVSDGNLDHGSFRPFHTFANGLWNLIGFAQAVSDPPKAVADHDDRAE
jgi:hypothetical protein